ncbi:MAG: hypothetical protein MZW92_26530 [Comamonadaceae bacterium]|nr:hypothetical protein [Comamonadaceae bacterium]
MRGVETGGPYHVVQAAQEMAKTLLALAQFAFHLAVLGGAFEVVDGE